MKDFPVTRFVERRVIVAITPEPGPSGVEERDVVIARFEAQIIPADVLAHVRALGGNLPRKSTSQPFASGGTRDEERAG